jgi:hypothetical protein
MGLTLGNAAMLTGLLITTLLSCSGCSSISSCNRDEEHVDVYDGYVNADRTIFSSVDPDRLEVNDGGADHALPSFDYFPANRILTFHIGLVGYPTTITPTLSFSPDGDATVAPCAGNQCLIRKRSKDQIVLRNDTCSEFWVWLTASTSATPFHPLTEGGAEGGASGADPTETAGTAGDP